MSAMVGPSPIFKVSRDTTRKIFFVASSPRRKAFPVLGMGRLLHPNLLNICAYRDTHNQLLPLPLSRPNTCLGRLFPCLHSPFSLRVGISLSWFQNTIISGKCTCTHVAKYARSPISYFFKFSIHR